MLMIDGVFQSLPVKAEAAVPGSFSGSGATGVLGDGLLFKRRRDVFPKLRSLEMELLTGGKAGKWADYMRAETLFKDFSLLTT